MLFGCARAFLVLVLVFVDEILEEGVVIVV